MSKSCNKIAFKPQEMLYVLKPALDITKPCVYITRSWKTKCTQVLMHMQHTHAYLILPLTCISPVQACFPVLVLQQITAS